MFSDLSQGVDFSNNRIAESVFISTSEHLAPIIGDVRIRSQANSRPQPNSWTRDLQILKELSSYPSGHEGHHFKWKSLERGLRELRWARTIQNAHINFQARGNLSGRKTLSPFSEGPMLALFLDYKLRWQDLFRPKGLEHRYLRMNYSLGFEKFVRESATLGPKSGSLPVLSRGIKELIRLSRMTNSRWPFSEYPDVPLVEAELSEDNLLELEGLPPSKITGMRLARVLNWRLFYLRCRGALR